jgi:hypothetical protein
MIGVGATGFLVSINLGKWTRRDMDRNTILFLAKVWGGIVVLGILLGSII